LLEEAVGAGGDQLVDLGLVDDAGDDEDAGLLLVAAFAEAPADSGAVDVGEHVVEQDEVRAEALGEHARVVAGGGGADLEASVAREEVVQQLEDLGVVVDDEDALAPGVEDLGGDVVGAHEAQQLVPRDAAETRARDAEALEAPGVEAADDGLLADLADLGGFAGREDLLAGPVADGGLVTGHVASPASGAPRGVAGACRA